MANPTWFNEQDYLTSKLDKLKAADSATYGSWTTERVKAAIESAGLTIYEHFEAFNKAEGTSPSKYFNAYEYIGAKVKALNAAAEGGRTDWTHDEVKAALESVGGAWAHYQQFGGKEGLNPSNAFSAEGYYAAKAASLGGEWTAASVKEYFVANGINPLDHYLTTGTTEGLAPVAAPASEQVPADPTNVGKTFTLTNGTDTFVGTAGNDIVDGTFANISDADTLIDQTSTDNDVLTLNAVNANYETTKMASISGIENITFNTQTAAAFTLDASKMSGVKNLTVNRGDLADGLISGKGAVNVTQVDASKVAKVTAGTQIDALTVNQVNKAGIVVDAKGVTGAVTVNGAAAITANDSTGTVSIAAGLGNATEDKKAVSIEAAKATTVTTAAALTGAINIKAAAATTVTVSESKGGVTVDAQAAKATITATGVTSAGATITAGTGTSGAGNDIKVNVLGTAATDDVATVSAAGVVTLNATAIETLNLSGNGAAANVALTASTLKNLTASGSNAVNVATDIDNLHQVTVAGVNELKINGGADAAARDLSKVSAAKIILEADAAQAVTVANAANIAVTVNQTDLALVAAAEGNSVTIAAAKFGTGAAAQTRVFGDVTLTGKFGAVNLVATEAAFDVGGGKSFNASVDTVVNITGDKAVTLNAVTAKQVVASTATGAITLTMSQNSKTVTTGSGNDVITVNDTTGTAVMSLNAGDGTNTINVTKLGNGSTLVAGAGDDSFNVAAGSTGSFVMQGGAGNDTYILADAADVVIADSAGSDKIVLSSVGAYDFTNKANFAFSGIEELDITAANAAVAMTGAQVSGKTLKLTGTADDMLTVSGKETADVINLSDVTINGTAQLKIFSSAGIDELIGSAKSSTDFVYSDAGHIVAGEKITGGAAIDSISYTGAAALALDLTKASISNIEVFNAGNATSVTIAQGSGFVTIDQFEATNSLILKAASTNFGATAAAAQTDVDAAGEWFIANNAGADVLSYFDEVTGATVDITLVGALNWTGAVVAGSLVLTAGAEV